MEKEGAQKMKASELIEIASKETLILLVDIRHMHYRKADALIRENEELGRILATKENEYREFFIERRKKRKERAEKKLISLSPWEMLAKADRRVLRTARTMHKYGEGTPEREKIREQHITAIKEREILRQTITAQSNASAMTHGHPTKEEAKSSLEKRNADEKIKMDTKMKEIIEKRQKKTLETQ